MSIAGLPEKSNNNQYYDYAKGICIICVILIHAIYVEDTTNLSIGQFVSIAIRQVINFPVAVFLGFAGFFVGVHISRGGSIKIWRRSSDLFIPYLIATAFYFVLYQVNPIAEGMIFIIKAIFLGSGIEIGYFVIVLVQLTLITPLIMLIKSDRTHIVVTVSMFFIGFLYTYLTNIFKISPLDEFPWSSIFFFTWYPVYHIGLYIGINKERVYSLSRNRYILPMVILLLVISLIEALYLRVYVEGPLFNRQIKASSILYATMVLVAFLSFKIPRLYVLTPYISNIGTSTYFIYLYHLVVLREVMDFSKTLIPGGLPPQLLAAFITLGIMVALINIARFFTQSVALKKYFGIGDRVGG